MTDRSDSSTVDIIPHGTVRTVRYNNYLWFNRTTAHITSQCDALQCEALQLSLLALLFTSVRVNNKPKRGVRSTTPGFSARAV